MSILFGGERLGLDKMPDIVTIQELAKFLKLTEQTVFRKIHRGEIKAFKAGRHWRIEKESVMEWVKKN